MANYQEISNYSYIGTQDTLGGLPVAEQTQAFIAAFKGVVSSTPEQIANASFFITYLIDEDGNVFKVSDNTDAQRDMFQNFASGDNVIVILDQGTLLNPQLAGQHSITGVGSFIPILVSQTGSTADANVNFFRFLNPGEVSGEDVGVDIKNFLGVTFNTASAFTTAPKVYDPATGNSYNNFPNYNIGSGIATGTNPATLNPPRDFTWDHYTTWLTSSAPDGDAATWPSNDNMADANSSRTGSYKFTSPKASFNTLTCRVTWGVRNYSTNDATVAVGVYRSSSDGYTLLDSATATAAKAVISNFGGNFFGNATLTEGVNTFGISTNDIEANDELFCLIGSYGMIQNWASNGNSYTKFVNEEWLYLATVTQSYDDGSEIIAPHFKWEISAQNPSITTPTSQLPFFTTSSGGSTVVTASSQLSTEYGNYQVLPTASSDFGFSPINYPFDIQPGDKVRFGYNSANIFTVFKVEEPPLSNRLYLTLDRNTGPNLNLNNFVIYRNLTDGKFLTLDVPKNDPQISEIDFTGIIVPEYASPKLKANANEIVAKLKSDGILTED